MGNKIGTQNGPKPGRPKGSPNKIGKEAKEVIAAAAAELGGEKRLVAWAREDVLNERAFWSTIYPKLIPLTLQGDPNKPLHVQHDVNPADKLKAMVTQIAERSGEAGISLPH
jgi:hypothetical protein